LIPEQFVQEPTTSSTGGPTFLQAADFHLGAVASVRLRLSAEQAAVRAAERRETLRRTCETAARRKVDVLLIPGNVCDSPRPDDADTAAVLDAFASVAPIPVVVAPGDRDPAGAQSIWNREFTRRRTGRAWPDNVHVFTGTEHSVLKLPSVPDCVFVGRSHPDSKSEAKSDSKSDAKLPTARIDRPGSPISVLLHHGSPASQRDRQRAALSAFADADLIAQGFSYTAVAHSGRRWTLKDSAGLVRAADAGGPFGDLGSTGAFRGGAIMGRLTAQGAASLSGSGPLETLELDPRFLREVRVDLSGAGDGDEVARRIRAAVVESGSRCEDLVYVVAAGLYSPGVQLPDRTAFADLNHFHFQIDWSAARPDYDLESLHGDGRGRPTVERRLVRNLMESIETADDDARRDLLENALYYGLDSLRQGRLDIRS